MNEELRRRIEARRDEELATIASVAAGAFGSSAAKRQYRAKHKATADALEWVLDLLDAQPAAPVAAERIAEKALAKLGWEFIGQHHEAAQAVVVALRDAGMLADQPAAVSLPEEAEPDDRLWLSSRDPHMDGSETVAVKKYPDPHRQGTVTVTVPSGYDLRPLPWFLAALAPAVSLPEEAEPAGICGWRLTEWDRCTRPADHEGACA